MIAEENKFDGTRKEDPEYLREWYQSRLNRWKGHINSDKIVKHYERAIKNLTNNRTNYTHNP